MIPTPTPRPAPRRVLEDASGRRLHRLRWIGRVVALLFFVWLLVVILGGLGVGPAAHVPFGRLLRPSSGPPPAHREPPAKLPTPADLAPALPAATPLQTAATARGKSAVAPGHVTAKPTAARGHSSVAPGKTTTLHGKAQTAPGRTRGRSATAPSHTTTTAPGRAKKP